MTFWTEMLGWLPLPGWLDLLDIGLVSVFGWLAIRYFRRTHAQTALIGLALLGVVYFIARSLNLRLATALFQGFFAIAVIVLVVVFQEELRRVFEQLGSWWQRRDQPPTAEAQSTLDLLVRTVARLAASRTGALIVIPGREPIDRHIDGGIALGGRASEPLLLSIFDSSSPGHDGAVILRGKSIESFAVHLPLSANHAALGPGGTRHAAALGLSERCDAICIVVSEERGTVSIARNGELKRLKRAEDLIVELGSVLRPQTQTSPWWQGRAGLDAALAMTGALVLWMVLVAGSDVSEATLQAKVEVTNLPETMQLDSTDPPAFEVVLEGPRRDLLLAERSGVKVQIDAYLARLGRRTFTISAQNVQAPDALKVLSINPDKVWLSLSNVPEPAATAPSPDAESPPDEGPEGAPQ
jgi:uncharacterized protein (TIGR00159 family)